MQGIKRSNSGEINLTTNPSSSKRARVLFVPLPNVSGRLSLQRDLENAKDRLLVKVECELLPGGSKQVVMDVGCVRVELLAQGSLVVKPDQKPFPVTVSTCKQADATTPCELVEIPITLPIQYSTMAKQGTNSCKMIKNTDHIFSFVTPCPFSMEDIEPYLEAVNLDNITQFGAVRLYLNKSGGCDVQMAATGSMQLWEGEWKKLPCIWSNCQEDVRKLQTLAPDFIAQFEKTEESKAAFWKRVSKFNF